MAYISLIKTPVQDVLDFIDELERGEPTLRRHLTTD